MAATIAVITAGYCLSLCFFADAISARLKKNRHIGRLLERAAGVFLVGFGIRLGVQ
jgi:threonine/homoserine/homoserine lactone efflux protein